ncbi:MAG: sarcosine oxidase subunit gamma family protein [Anaerolineae bacterium]|nr:sarcosine oxidase subunit gamma family protein [Anaerolineae bacterium]
MTEFTPIFRSPISAPEVPPVTSGLRAHNLLRVQDLTGVQVTLIQGQAEKHLKKHFKKVPGKPGELLDVGDGVLARLTPTEFYLFGKSAAARPTTESDLEDAAGFVHTTDATHGQTVLKLTGADAPEALSKICGLDFHDTVFPNMAVKQTSAAKIKTLIARCDENGEPTYHLHVSRPLGQYFWDILWDAGQEYGIGFEQT